MDPMLQTESSRPDSSDRVVVPGEGDDRHLDDGDGREEHEHHGDERHEPGRSDGLPWALSVPVLPGDHRVSCECDRPDETEQPAGDERCLRVRYGCRQGDE